jgi:hypothetical protein
VLLLLLLPHRESSAHCTVHTALASEAALQAVLGLVPVLVLVLY